ncbi:prepilin peptidase [Clostridium aminobutyricum]|uniref:Prepilin peptidase n=1 Tax=Clostridium aminobutyricum TaxID=33953 RepID=A0A939IHK4_CLOAM|nr:prepilin peptidase [Clostridium aminobutyricum]MBN7773892.1 prepilin peptidase [Clostridium aminobutyricum]
MTFIYILYKIDLILYKGGIQHCQQGKLRIGSMLYLLPFIVIGLIASFILLTLFNRIPIAWFCDYDEKEPDTSYKKQLQVLHWLLPFTLFLAFCFYFLLAHYSFHKALLLFFVICILIHVSLSDLLYRIIPDQHVIALVVLGVLCILLEGPSFTFHFISALIGGSLYLLVAFIGLLFKQQDAIGFGDVKLMTALGFITGVYNILSIFVLTTLLSTLFLIAGLLARQISLQSLLPLAPFISIASIIQFLL